MPSTAELEPLLHTEQALSELVRGRVAVIDLWATWCEPCRETIPKIVRLHGALAPEGLVVVGVHVGEGAGGAARFAADANMTYPQYADPSFAFSDRLGSRQVPTLLVVDHEGKVAFRGEALDESVLQLVRELLDAAKQPQSEAP